METRVSFTVKGLSTEGAEEKLSQALYGITGVDTVDFDTKRSRVVVCGMELERADLAEKICETGFEVAEG